MRDDWKDKTHKGRNVIKNHGSEWRRDYSQGDKDFIVKEVQ